MIPSLATRAPHAASIFKRAGAGLFAGKMKQYGNNVPHSKQKTRRTWLPNIQSKKLYSESLGTTMKTKVTTRALKTIDKYGGLDAYLLNTKISSLGDKGLRMRERVLDAREKSLQEAKTIAA